MAKQSQEQLIVIDDVERAQHLRSVFVGVGVGVAAVGAALTSTEHITEGLIFLGVGSGLEGAGIWFETRRRHFNDLVTKKYDRFFSALGIASQNNSPSLEPDPVLGEIVTHLIRAKDRAKDIPGEAELFFGGSLMPDRRLYNPDKLLDAGVNRLVRRHFGLGKLPQKQVT